jgi:S-adenosylmethionine:tRNA ribosyltransferase-isomerase
MKLDDFFYELAPERIAQFPLKDRGLSRMLVLDRGTGSMEHSTFNAVAKFFLPGDALVINNTRVFKARIRGKKETGGNFEALLVRKTEHGSWEALVHSSKRLKIGGRVFFADGLQAVVKDKVPGRCFLEFNQSVDEYLDRIGIVPLPHYIKRDTVPADELTYQTVYAKETGSIAAPTAGFHFTPEILQAIREKGCEIVELTLHIGPGTFKPIRTNTVEKHVMDAEYVEITGKAVESINAAKRVIGVGTSVTRSLESAASPDPGKRIKPFSGFTGLFIYPGHRFRVIDRLITNFHLPCSTPLLLVCAFAGKDLIFKAYAEAIRENYRFLSYGDAMMIV